MLLPMFRESGGVKGWQAMQVNPRFYRSTEKTVAHAAELSALNENILIKMPVSTADIPALEECAPGRGRGRGRGARPEAPGGRGQAH